MRSRLTGPQLDRQKATTELLKRYRTADDKHRRGVKTAEDTDRLMKQAQAILYHACK